VTESKAVWKDLGSKRIGKSLDRVRVRRGRQGTMVSHGVHIVCICIAEIKGMTSEHM